ncbi:MAG: eCIS core domain-containing protein [Methylobacter sp.]
MKVAQKQSNNSNRSTAEASQSSCQNQLAQIANNSKEAVAQRSFIASINDSQRMLAQRRQIEGYMGSGQLKQHLTPPSHLVSSIQTKLIIGQPVNKFEQEADRIATQVVEQINTPTSAESTQMQSVQREAMPEEGLQTKSILQRREAMGEGEASTDLESAINNAKGSGQPLDTGLQRSIGQAMGADFSGVRVHTDAQADQLTRSLQAKAFTTGQDVFFRQGAYDPGNRGGQELIAHELTHVVQQSINNELQAETGYNRKRLDKTHQGLVLNRATPLIQPKRIQILDHEWDDHLNWAVTPEKMERVKKNYNDSQVRGNKIRDRYNAWRLKKPEQQADKKGSTRTFKSKGYKTDIEKLSDENFKIKTYREIKQLFELEGNESVDAKAALEGKNINKIKDILQSKKFFTYSDLDISELTAEKDELVWENSTFVSKKLKSPRWQIMDKGGAVTKSDIDRYGRAYIAKLGKNVLDDTMTVEFYGFEKVPNKPEIIPYSNTYSLKAGKFTAEKNFKEWEADMTFAEANSEIIWNQYKSAIKAARNVSNKQDLKYAGNLSEIERNTIINQQTLDTIFLCNEGGKVLKPGQKATVHPEGQDSEDFWALIGTPNGTSAGHLIIDHGTVLGLEAIESIEYQQMQMNIKYRKRQNS